MLPVSGGSGSLRVLLTTDAVGGVWTYALDLAAGLAEQGIETALAVLGPEPEADQAEAARAVPGLRLLPTGLPLDWLAETPAEVEAASLALSALAAEAGADLVHLHSPALAAGGARFTVPVAASCHSCVGTWWDTVRGGPLPPDFAWRARLVARGCAGADALLAPTAAFAEATARFYGLAEPPTVIRNGRRPPHRRLHAPRPSAAARRPSPSPPAGSGTKARTCARSTAPRAGSPARCRCWRRARPTAPAARASPSTTPAPSGASARTRSRAGSPNARSSFPPPATSPSAFPCWKPRRRDAPWCCPTYRRFRELWDGAADFVPADDDRALAAAVERAARDPARLGAAARRRAERYTVEAMASGTSALYRALLRRAATAAAAAGEAAAA